MGKLPGEIKLTLHAKQRLEERKDTDTYYNTKNLMRSSVKWYGKDDLIPQSNLYLHCLYVCRKSKGKMRYLTDGKIEVLYDKGAGVAITILEVKDKFKPITQYIKPEVLEQVRMKKANKNMDNTLNLEYCPTIKNEEVIEEHKKNTDCIEEAVIKFQELYASLLSELVTDALNDASNKKNSSNYNIVYREKLTKPMSISELFGIGKKEEIKKVSI